MHGPSEWARHFFGNMFCVIDFVVVLLDLGMVVMLNQSSTSAATDNAFLAKAPRIARVMRLARLLRAGRVIDAVTKDLDKEESHFNVRLLGGQVCAKVHAWHAWNVRPLSI